MQISKLTDCTGDHRIIESREDSTNPFVARAVMSLFVSVELFSEMGHFKLCKERIMS